MTQFVRFERGRDDVIGPTFGPFEFLQITYGELRDDQDRTLAYLHEDGDWHLGAGFAREGFSNYFSDFILYNS